jgi:hypothetical protein
VGRPEDVANLVLFLVSEDSIGICIYQYFSVAIFPMLTNGITYIYD